LKTVRLPKEGVFELSVKTIDPASLGAAMRADAAGAIVTFEGWVRHRNEGREVRLLEFEGDRNLACHEFAKIEAEAMAAFDILSVSCVHRTGSLAVGELAVWIGVAAGHRDGAFKACRYVIDELKQRLPIWKKEHYLDGDSGWLNHP